MIYIFAGNFQECRQYARHKRIPYQSYRYIDRLEQMMGVEYVTVLLIGTWRERDSKLGLNIREHIIARRSWYIEDRDF